MNKPQIIYSLFSIVILFWIVVSDLKSRKVPNIALLMLTVLVASTLPFSALNLAVSFLVLLFGFAAFHKKVLGAGDSKLLAVCVYAAQSNWLDLLFVSALSGGVLATFALLYNNLITRNLITGKTIITLPYAVAIISAAVITIPYMEIS